MKNIKLNFDIVVVGGGLAGCCAAISAARRSCKVALVNNRPVLGGNASSEVGLLVASADRDFKHARETGILEEINLHNRFRNHEIAYNNYNMDMILWEMVKDAGIDLFLNTNVDKVEMNSDVMIKSIFATQLGSEKRFELVAPLFVDSSGDGILADLSGAEYRRGSESKFEFDENLAPEEENNITQGSTLMFRTKNIGRPAPFVKPDWAYHFPKPEDLPKKVGKTDGGFLWIEYGAKLDTISDNEEIRDELWKILYGVWDHLKNHGDYGMENDVLSWVANWPGKRESRRVMGDYILKQTDITDPTEYQDAVAYGGWPCDVHNPDGFWAKNKWLNYLYLDKPYPIPYRCYYSKNINNLFVAGRIVSATHIAHGSTRVMGTTAVGGQAVGTAASLAIKYNQSPREIGENHIQELQQVLIKEDCYIPEISNKDKHDFAQQAKVSATSEFADESGYIYKSENVISGVSRGNTEDENLWMSQAIEEDKPCEIFFEWDEAIETSSIQLTFDTMIREQRFFDRPVFGAMETCIKDYSVLSESIDGEWLEIASKLNNYLRHNILKFKSTKTKKLKIKIEKTNGDAYARIYEARIY
ncbi:MAG: FAD-dependent oxidoreductase [Planctomycetota bacterium]|nr:MAG: FAD-dependent oxidoreductase [Planctomycetota bacterium]